MSERQEEVSRARLIECFGKDFTNIGKPVQKQKTGKRNLPEPPYVVNSFLTFLVNNKLNLRQIFSAEIASKRITVKQLKDFCESNHYQSSQGDFSVIVRFFTPPNAMPSARSARSGGAKDGRKSAQSLGRDRSRQSLQTEEDDPIDLIKIIVYARRIDVNYAKDDVAEGGETEFVELGYKVKPEMGKLLMFPCNQLYPHKGNKPISNGKHVFTAFVCMDIDAPHLKAGQHPNQMHGSPYQKYWGKK